LGANLNLDSRAAFAVDYLLRSDRNDLVVHYYFSFPT